MPIPEYTNIHGLSYRHDTVDATQTCRYDGLTKSLFIDTEACNGLKFFCDNRKKLFPILKGILIEKASMPAMLHKI